VTIHVSMPERINPFTGHRNARTVYRITTSVATFTN